MADTMKLDTEDSDKLWQNTRRYRTKDSEITTLWEALTGLKESGYELRGNFLFEGPHHLLIKYEDYGKALERIIYEGEKTAKVDFSYDDYKNGNIGLHASSILTDEDLLANPKLMTLLIGELFDYMYFCDNIITTPEKEIIWYYTSDKRKRNILRTIPDLTYKEASEIANETATIISEISSEEYRLNEYDILSDGRFEHEQKISGHLDIEFKDDLLWISKKPLYKVTTIEDSTLILRENEKKYEDLKGNPYAQKNIMKGIEHRKSLLKLKEKQGRYFPALKILDNPSYE